jgi:hypothetical protein
VTTEKLEMLAGLLRQTADMHREHSIAITSFLGAEGDTLAVGAMKLAGNLDSIAEKIEEGEYDS